MLIFIVLIAFTLLQQKINFNHIKEYGKIKIFVTMFSEDTEILEFNQYQKSDKAPFITPFITPSTMYNRKV